MKEDSDFDSTHHMAYVEQDLLDLSAATWDMVGAPRLIEGSHEGRTA